MYITAMILLIFFAAIGIAAFITELIGMVTQSKDTNEYLLILPHPKAQTAEGQLRSMISKASDLNISEILCLCEEDEEELREIVERLQRTAPRLKAVTKAKMKEKLGL